MLAAALASMIVVSNPDVIYLNSRYAIVQEEKGLVCYGCSDKPTLIAGSNKIPYDQQPLIEASSGFAVFLTTDITDECPAGKQWAVNLASATMEYLGTPCQASDMRWSFSESEVKYSYMFSGEKVVKHYQIAY